MRAGETGIVFSILAVRLPVLAFLAPVRRGHSEACFEKAAEKGRGGKPAVQRNPGDGGGGGGGQQNGRLFQAEAADVLRRRLADHRREDPVEMERGKVRLRGQPGECYVSAE